MKIVLILFSILIAKFVVGQTKSIFTPYYARDSVYISGSIKDESGNPVEHALILLHEFSTEKFDVTWFEQDTFYSNKKGQFSVALNGGQFSNRLFFEKEGFFNSYEGLKKDSMRIIIKNPIILYNRSLHFFDSKKIDSADLMLTVGKALEKYKIGLYQTSFFELTDISCLRFEMADSAMILLAVNNEETAINKSSIINKKITGIGIAFTDGKKLILGEALKKYQRKIYNDYYSTKQLSTRK